MTVNLPKTMTAVAIALMAMVLIVPVTIVAADASDGRIARVNDADILRQDLDREMKLVSLKLARQGRAVNDEQLKRYEGDIRETLINRTLLLQQSHSMGIDVKDSLVAKALDEFKAAFNDDTAYTKALTEMGFSEAMLKDQIKNGLTIKALIDQSVLHCAETIDRSPMTDDLGATLCDRMSACVDLPSVSIVAMRATACRLHFGYISVRPEHQVAVFPIQ